MQGKKPKDLRYACWAYWVLMLCSAPMPSPGECMHTLLGLTCCICKAIDAKANWASRTVAEAAQRSQVPPAHQRGQS